MEMEESVADVWANYREVADLCGCLPDEARALVALRGWPRRRCSDSVTRTKLPDDLAQLLMMRSVSFGLLDKVTHENLTELNRLKRSFIEPLDGVPADPRMLRQA